MVHNQTAHHFSVTHWYKSIFFTRQMIENVWNIFFCLRTTFEFRIADQSKNFLVIVLTVWKWILQKSTSCLHNFNSCWDYLEFDLSRNVFFFTIWFENSIKTALQICNLWTGRPVSLKSVNWFRLNFHPQMATIFHICKWQNFFTYANGYLLPFQLLS